jgi:hypothetical protein
MKRICAALKRLIINTPLEVRFIKPLTEQPLKENPRFRNPGGGGFLLEFIGNGKDFAK